MTVFSPNASHLPALLDQFRAKYGNLRVDAAPIDVTLAYWSDEAGRFIAPRSYGNLPDNRVIGYVAFGATLIEKFAKDEEGRVMREDGVPLIADFGMEQAVMACLCLHDMRNTSLFEVGDALEGTHRIQGYRRWHLRTLTEAIRSRHPTFSPRADSCFLFAGNAEAVRHRIALNACWLQQVSQFGATSLTSMSPDESSLMERVFPVNVLAGEAEGIRERSYMWGRDLWEPLSSEFLVHKAAAWRSFNAAASQGIHQAAT